jgi:dihydrofolate reductase
MPKFVVSTSLKKPEWNNSTVISGDVAAEVGKLKEQFANDVAVHGSAQLVNTLKEHDLVDEYRLMVFPVVLGKGKRLFSDGGDLTSLKLSEAKQVGTDGVIILTYQRAPK